MGLRRCKLTLKLLRGCEVRETLRCRCAALSIDYWDIWGTTHRLVMSKALVLIRVLPKYLTQILLLITCFGKLIAIYLYLTRVLVPAFVSFECFFAEKAACVLKFIQVTWSLRWIYVLLTCKVMWGLLIWSFMTLSIKLRERTVSIHTLLAHVLMKILYFLRLFSFDSTAS